MKKYMTLLAIAALAFAGCNKTNDKQDPTDPDIKTGSITLSEDAVVAGPEGQTFEIKVTSSSDWHVAGYSDWVNFTSLSGKSGENLVLTVAENTGDKALQAEFRVFSDDAVKVLKVTSAPVYIVKLLDGKTEFDTSPDAGEYFMTLVTNAESLTAETNASWITVKSISEVLGKTKACLEVARSQEFKAREATVTFRAPNMEPVEVKVTQAQRDTAFVVEGAKIVKGLEAFDQTLTIRTNVEDLSYTLPSWISETSASETEMDEEGLRTRTIAVHADANSGSRASNVAFRSGSKAIGSVYLKQQTPNPVYAEIEDPALASVLENTGWILKDPENGQCEVLEAGLTGTSLTVNDGNVTVISGLDAFPALTTLSIGSSLRALVRVDTGNTKVSRIAFGNGHYFTGTELAIAGAGITDIVVACSSWQVYYGYDKLVTLDVSGCPALETLDARRQYSTYEGPLRTIYMTQAQSEKVTVQKNPSAQIVIK